MLTITGTGDMPDFIFDSENYSNPNQYNHPWFGKAFSKIVVAEGVTGIGDNAFAFHGCGYLSKVELPATLKQLGGAAFAYATIEELIIPDGVKTLGSVWKDEQSGESGEYAAIFYLPNLKSVTIPASVENFYGDELAGCESIKTIKSDPEDIFRVFSRNPVKDLKKIKIKR